MITTKKSAVLLSGGALAVAVLMGTAGVASAAPAGAGAAATAATTAASGWYCGYEDGTPYTDRGDRGNKVREVQCLLRDVWGFNIGSTGVDGDFGKATEDAVKAFQRSRGLAADGKVGPNTWRKLRGQ
ncbi:peptidoglycan-binding domain-containing protein [Streptomyces virginiae]|uniref:peptidoglycan-binding domain-containing protein n=1 Tax=Streptomyces virginiae TaxID=1961 RepID=UPI002DB89831|nr:peptidoglycan-binding domain-containing protein [Streptomyces sp. CMAA1738]MEC4573985.1 peptidoglycan-binding domain-containing protein [Streptomyces sp. CMAA1738]